MTHAFATAVSALRALSQREKIELLYVITQDLQQGTALAEGHAAFWNPTSLDEIIAMQNAPIIDNILRIGGEEAEDETADEINAYIAQRRAES